MTENAEQTVNKIRHKIIHLNCSNMLRTPNVIHFIMKFQINHPEVWQVMRTMQVRNKEQKQK